MKDYEKGFSLGYDDHKVGKLRWGSFGEPWFPFWEGYRDGQKLSLSELQSDQEWERTLMQPHRGVGVQHI